MFHVMTGAHYPYPASLCHKSDEAARFALNMLYSSHKEVNADQSENMFYSSCPMKSQKPLFSLRDPSIIFAEHEDHQTKKEFEHSKL